MHFRVDCSGLKIKVQPSFSGLLFFLRNIRLRIFDLDDRHIGTALLHRSSEELGADPFSPHLRHHRIVVQKAYIFLEHEEGIGQESSVFGKSTCTQVPPFPDRLLDPGEWFSLIIGKIVVEIFLIDFPYLFNCQNTCLHAASIANLR